jgi:hypothetical protein
VKTPLAQSGRRSRAVGEVSHDLAHIESARGLTLAGPGARVGAST